MSLQQPEARTDDDPIADELAALERRIDTLVAELRALLPPEQFRLVWELRDAEEMLGYARRRSRAAVQATRR